MLLRSSKAILLFLPAILLSCSDNSGVIDPSLDTAQQAVSFRSVLLSSYSFDTDTISVVPGKDKSPGDAISVVDSVFVNVDAAAFTPITGATCEVYTDKEGDKIATLALTRASNGLLTGVLRLNIRRGDVGDYRVVVNGTTADAKTVVNPVVTKIRVSAVKRPPHFCGITAPDTVTLPPDGFVILKLQACVSDSSGRADIKRVYFNSYFPNGSASTGNPFFLYDDGSHGDAAANDGTYTLDVQLLASAQKGKYRFEFFVNDFSNLNAFVSHSVYVVN